MFRPNSKQKLPTLSSTRGEIETFINKREQTKKVKQDNSKGDKTPKRKGKRKEKH